MYYIKCWLDASSTRFENIHIYIYMSAITYKVKILQWLVSKFKTHLHIVVILFLLLNWIHVNINWKEKCSKKYLINLMNRY